MYVVIQEVKLKKQNEYGYYTDLEVSTSRCFGGGKEIINYSYYRTNKAIREIKKAYKFSIHQSYREDGKVKKKQYVVCTINYYDAVDGFFPFYDYAENKIKEIADKLGVDEDLIYNLLEDKGNPIAKEIQKEFEQTEEYIKNKEVEMIVAEYRKRKTEFNNKYSSYGSTYEQIYDVFNTLRNKEKLEEVKQNYKIAEETRRYYEKNYSNYNYNSQSSYYNIKQSNYKEEDKSKYKKMYKTLAAKFHPDVYNDNGDMMKLINQLKEDWGL